MLRSAPGSRYTSSKSFGFFIRTRPSVVTSGIFTFFAKVSVVHMEAAMMVQDRAKRWINLFILEI